jgi:hypothetical protein
MRASSTAKCEARDGDHPKTLIHRNGVATRIIIQVCHHLSSRAPGRCVRVCVYVYVQLGGAGAAHEGTRVCNAEVRAWSHYAALPSSSTPACAMRSESDFSSSSIREPISSIRPTIWSLIPWNLSCICPKSCWTIWVRSCTPSSPPASAIVNLQWDPKASPKHKRDRGEQRKGK